MLADKVSGNLVGTFLLLPEHLRLGTWELLCGWSRRSGERVEPRLALQIVHEAALCNHALRRVRSLSQRGFELANGLPFVASDPAIHRLLDAHTLDEAQALQIALGRIRRASGHFPGRLVALDPHRIRSYSRRQMRRRKDGPQGQALKVSQTFFAVDVETRQPLGFTLTSSGPSVTQASPELLRMVQAILNPSPGQTLLLADTEHYADDLIAHVQRQTPFDLLTPAPRHSRVTRALEALPDAAFTPRWAGFATTKTPFGLEDSAAEPALLFVQQEGEPPGPTTRRAFLCTADRPEADDLAQHYPLRWHAEEFFNLDDALGWDKARTLNLHIRYGLMTLALLAQAAVHQLRQRLPHPLRTWTAEHLATALLQGLDGDLRVCGDTLLVTYYNAPSADQLRRHFSGLPDRLPREGVDPRIPWLYDLKLDFRFR